MTGMPDPSVGSLEAIEARLWQSAENDSVENGRFPIPCACGEDGCKGWQMTSWERVLDEILLGRLLVNDGGWVRAASPTGEDQA